VWVALEISFHGLSVALIDSTPRELMQLNLRRAELKYVSSGLGTKSALTLGSFSIDNMLPDNFNPLVLSSRAPLEPQVAEPADEAADENEPTAAARSASVGDAAATTSPYALELLMDRRGHSARFLTYRDVQLTISPLKLVLDLALLKALSTMTTCPDASSVASSLIACSPRLITTFASLRAVGIVLPEELMRGGAAAAAAAYLQHVRIGRMTLQVTVSMASTLTSGSHGGVDPVRELLEVGERLLPQVPKALEPLIPVLSNLASITEAVFDLKPYEMRDEFSTPRDVAASVGRYWAAKIVWDLMKAMGSSDMIGNPLGLVNRFIDTGEKVGKHLVQGVKTRNMASAGQQMWLEVLHGVIGGSADSVAKLLRSVNNNSTPRSRFTYELGDF
jgi:hypothetical protein